jgi:hypothetical protein
VYYAPKKGATGKLSYLTLAKFCRATISTRLKSH